jgi:hypothetical protein
MSDYESDEIRNDYSSLEDEPDIKWNKVYNDVINYVNCNETFPMKLKAWIHTQFYYLEKNNDQLSKERLEKLLSIKKLREMYETKIKKSNWNDSYSELKSFVNKFNRLPKISENKTLLSWLRHQKENILAGKYDKLNNYKKQKLLQIKGFSEFLQRRKLDCWNEKYEQLEEFIKINNQLPSNSSTSLAYEKILAKWLTLQIQLLRGNREWNLKEERKELLMKIDLIRNRV